MTPTSDRHAQTSVPLHPLLAQRWSPRAFDARPISAADRAGLFEAARWAASCFGAQPWRFVFGVAGQGDAHAKLAETLMPANRLWAERAPLLMLSIARLDFEHNGKPNAWAQHDVGLAVAQLTIEAQARGLVVHQMGGFDADKARELLAIPAGYAPVAAIAIGHPGDPSELPEELAARESAARERKPLDELFFEGALGAASE